LPEREVICGSAPEAPETRPSTQRLRLQLDGPERNVDLRLEDISRPMVADVPPLLTDLVEIAAYVFAADQMVTRGGPTMVALGRDWRRSFRFLLPVRCLDVWTRSEITEALAQVLGFMSEDSFRFEFSQLHEPREFSSYLDLGPARGGKFTSDEVLLFSGGMDSLCGSLVELGTPRKRLLLVSHQSSTKMAQRQRALADELRSRFPERVFHVPVRAGMARQAPREFTQRTRSFLFAAIAAAVGARQQRIRFYENGVVSFNLPIAGQVIGTRASRTTHPRTLQLLGQLLGLLLEREFPVENPFIWKTRSQVAVLGAASGHKDLVGQSVSCSRIRSMTADQPHCGVCSQCVDRRFATLAAGFGESDLGVGYRVDLLTGQRDSADDRTMAESYVRHALELHGMSLITFTSRFANELARAIHGFPGTAADDVVRFVYELHQRHAADVVAVLVSGVRNHAEDLVGHRLADSCILRLAVDEKGTAVQMPNAVTEEPRERYAGSIQQRFEQTLDIEMALPADGRAVVFSNAGKLVGRAARQLLDRLVGPYFEDQKAQRPIDKCRFMCAPDLAKTLEIEEETLRRRVSLFRKRVAKLFQEQCGLPLTADAVIETKERSGYRLNPRVRVVALKDIAHLITSHGVARHVTSPSPQPRKSTP
jgi:7-cyano-7-deazaguanine synthase in queuosine biosynthesis